MAEVYITNYTVQVPHVNKGTILVLRFREMYHSSINTDYDRFYGKYTHYHSNLDEVYFKPSDSGNSLSRMTFKIEVIF